MRQYDRQLQDVQRITLASVVRYPSTIEIVEVDGLANGATYIHVVDAAREFGP